MGDDYFEPGVNENKDTLNEAGEWEKKVQRPKYIKP